MKYHFELTYDEFKSLVDRQLVFDGTKGGLVLGKLHKNGGIHFLQECPKNKLRYLGEMEGWEYLTAPLTEYNTSHFLRINETTKNINQDIDTSFEIPANCKIIDTSDSQIAFLFIGYNQFVINRLATKNNIDLIIELDK